MVRAAQLLKWRHKLDNMNQWRLKKYKKVMSCDKAKQTYKICTFERWHINKINHIRMRQQPVMVQHIYRSRALKVVPSLED